MKTDHEILLPAKVNTNRKFFVVMLGVALLLLILNLKNLNFLENVSHVRLDIPTGFLVYNDHCQIEDHSPYDPHTMKYFTPQNYAQCIKKPRLAEVKFNKSSGKYVLIINKPLRKAYGKDLECCYHKIYRPPYDEDADIRVSIGSCWNVTNSVEIAETTENIIVRCKNKKLVDVYLDGFATMPEKDEVRKRLERWKKEDKPIKVMMLGIDSVSRLNLIRAMPHTRQFLERNGWFELNGYNKIEDNTFPNLMAILTGYNTARTAAECDAESSGKLELCPFLWKDFRNEGYVTAFAEDAANLSTFNYLKEGFEERPTDYYIRPFILEAERILPITKLSGLPYCLGYKHEGEYVFDYAIEFTERFNSSPYFGFFWANTFSHNNISDASSMDDRMIKYLNKIQATDSVIFFFSDHGMRFGPTRSSPIGHYEERLPFMFIYLPKWLKDKYPKWEESLRFNKNQLTNPYDIHMTVQSLLRISAGGEIKPADGCPKCQSVFEKVPPNRSCEDLAIEDHWCMCNNYVSESTSQQIGNFLGNFMVAHINNFVMSYKNGNFTETCNKLSLKSVDVLRVNRKNSLYIITFTTDPNGSQFEATVKHSPGSVIETSLRGDISRLNIYKFDAFCVNDGGIKKYCSCSKNVTKT
ncbi:hypothetical protein ACFFRR_002840 [Megaselia abdita]